MDTQTAHSYEFGPFHIDTANHLLLRDGQVVPLKPKVFDALVVLVENRGRVLEKDKLMGLLWPDSFVEEANLTQTIYMLRKALGEEPHEHNYIETVPKRGYRFVAGVKQVPGESVELIAAERTWATLLIEEEETTDVQEEASAAVVPHRGIGPRLPVLLACALLVALAVAGYYFQAQRAEPSAPTSLSNPIKSIAVLPFKPLVAESRDESLELGMADSLIMRLNNLGHLTVRPLTAVRRYIDLEQDAIKAGQELHVDSVLEGNIQRFGDRIRVRVSLVRIADGRPLWAEQFDEKFTDILAVQDSISERVAGALVMKLTGEERELLKKRYTDNTEAYQLYLKGRYFWNKLNVKAAQTGIKYFNQAIELDPHYALAYAGLADSYNLLGNFGGLPMKVSYPEARAAAEKALGIDDTLAEAHTSLAGVLADYYWDWPESERHFKRAIELNPNYAIAHEWYSAYLDRMGRLDEAIREAQRAQEIDPLSLSASVQVGAAYYWARQYDQAIEQMHKALEMDPNAMDAHRVLGLSFVQKGMHREAIAKFNEARRLFGNHPQMVGLLGYSYGIAGRESEARGVLDELNGLSKQRYVSPISRAAIHIGLGETDRAFEWLEKAYVERVWVLGILKVEPVFDPLHSDPRFTDLLQRMNLTL